MSIKELLDHDDIEIVTTGTGAGALSTLRENPCDCVVLDLRLPDMSGFDVLDSIRNDEELSDVPVVVFTGGSFRSRKTRNCIRWREASW